MRTKNSVKNAIFSMISNVFTILIGLVAQFVFIKILGSEYLGLNSLFSNVITMLAIVELGIGNAIIYSLYKPIADNNINEIKKCKYYILYYGLLNDYFIFVYVFSKVINIIKKIKQKIIIRK